MISLHRTRLSFLPDLALDIGPSLISFLGPRNAVGAVKSSRLNIPQLPSSNVKSKDSPFTSNPQILTQYSQSFLPFSFSHALINPRYNPFDCVQCRLERC